MKMTFAFNQEKSIYNSSFITGKQWLAGLPSATAMARTYSRPKSFSRRGVPLPPCVVYNAVDVFPCRYLGLESVVLHYGLLFAIVIGVTKG